ncbi:MAG: AraC family transcriptional regulator [Bacteroidales bacterium]|nr:AraC family transcriptional regulator [Bacteroidales bacterium]MBR0501359.1 AraC family transcriptional regulator [Bacteroidales bacterium]
MSDLLLLIGYPPLIVALVFLAIRDSRKRGEKEAPGPPKEYPYQDRAIPHAGRFLEDSGQSLKDSDMEDLKERLCNVLEREKLYLNPDIRVSDLAERLYTNKSYLAQTIKIKLNKNFCQLVHYYRVREAMRLYAHDPDLTITQLCRRVGFNSMTTFNTAFGRNTGYTPAEWCKQYRKKNESPANER